MNSVKKPVSCNHIFLSAVIYLFLSTSPIGSFAQLKLTVIICDQNKRPIPYTNVVSTQKRNGTATDEKGQFTLTDISITDTLKISAIGYQPLFIPAQQFKNHDTLFLKEDIKVLDEVMIKDTDHTVYNIDAKLGFFTYSKHDYFMLDPGLEVGIFIAEKRW